MKRSFRILSLLLALIFILSLAPLAAFADGEDTEMTEEQLLLLKKKQEEEEEKEAAAAAAAAAVNNAPAPLQAPAQGAAPPPLQAPAQGAAPATVIPDNPAGGTVDEVKTGETMDTNNGEITTNNGEVTTNNGEVTNNEFDVDTNNGTVTNNDGTVTNNNGEVTNNNGGVTNNDGLVVTNNGEITNNDGIVGENTHTITNNSGLILANEGTVSINTGAVRNRDTGIVDYNAGGTVEGGTVNHDGYGLTVSGLPEGATATVSGTDVVTQGDTSFAPKETEDLKVSVSKKKGYKLDVSAGETSYTKTETDAGWTVSFGTVLGNLKVMLSKILNCGPVMVIDHPTVDEQYMDFIRSVVKKIKEAPKNTTVEVDAGPWLSYRTEVFQALAERTDVSLRTTYRRDGKLMRFTIPAGTDVVGAVGRRVVVEYPDLAKLLDITPETLK